MVGLKGIFRRRSNNAAESTFSAPIAPDYPFVAIGDIHGRADLLEQLEQLILSQAPGLPAVFVGDYLDRGEESARVIELLMSSSESGAQPVHCLKGNHEQMCLRFLDDPETNGARWLKFGGLQTLASYGVRVAGMDASALRRTRDDLALAMGDPVIEWLRSRPLIWRSGNVSVTHAGADPALAIDAQSERALLWGHKDFPTQVRRDGQWVVHGHVIVDQPSAGQGRIAVDTGAYATGRLTAAVISLETVHFLTT